MATIWKETATCTTAELRAYADRTLKRCLRAYQDKHVAKARALYEDADAIRRYVRHRDGVELDFPDHWRAQLERRP